jgi:hypothetical protein
VTGDRSRVARSSDRGRQSGRHRSFGLLDAEKPLKFLPGYEKVPKFPTWRELITRDGAAYGSWADPEEIGSFLNGKREAFARGDGMLLRQFVSWACA